MPVIITLDLALNKHIKAKQHPYKFLCAGFVCLLGRSEYLCKFRKNLNFLSTLTFNKCHKISRRLQELIKTRNEESTSSSIVEKKFDSHLLNSL